MARPLGDLQAMLKALPEVTEAYIQAPTSGMVDPYIMIERGGSTNLTVADNIKYLTKKGYTVTVVDRRPDSQIPDLVEGLQHSRFDRYFRTNGLHHFVFQIFF